MSAALAGHILALNAGSSSIKFALFEAGGGILQPLGHGEVEGLGSSPVFRVSGEAPPRPLSQAGATLSHEDVLGHILEWVVAQEHGAPLLAIGHRIVHGGRDHAAPVLLDAAMLDALGALSGLAPLHQPHNLAAVRAAMAVHPGVPQIGCFDTAFHRTIPELATRFALPRRLHEAGVRRYGFHGLSYEYLARRLSELDPARARGRILLAHLGNGASLCALHEGRSVGTTMGFTALDGLVMGTRCGSLDPGVVLHLIQEQGLTPDAVAHMLTHEAGLLGVSGVSSDMRALLASERPEASEAVELFCLSVARHTGELVSEMGGLEGVVFSGGIGEHAAPVRARIVERLGWLGLSLDREANAAHAAVISRADSRVWARVIPTDEERMVALHCLEVLAARPA